MDFFIVRFLIAEGPLLFGHTPLKFLFLVLHLFFAFIHEWEDCLSHIQMDLPPLLVCHALVKALTHKWVRKPKVSVELRGAHHLDEFLALQIVE